MGTESERAALRDKLVSRCPACGAWRFGHHPCTTGCHATPQKDTPPGELGQDLPRVS